MWAFVCCWSLCGVFYSRRAGIGQPQLRTPDERSRELVLKCFYVSSSKHAFLWHQSLFPKIGTAESHGILVWDVVFCDIRSDVYESALSFQQFRWSHSRLLSGAGLNYEQPLTPCFPPKLTFDLHLSPVALWRKLCWHVPMVLMRPDWLLVPCTSSETVPATFKSGFIPPRSQTRGRVTVGRSRYTLFCSDPI